MSYLILLRCAMFASIAPFMPIHYETCVHSVVNADVEGKCRGRRKDGREDMVVAEEDVSKSGHHLITPMRLQLRSDCWSSRNSMKDL